MRFFENHNFSFSENALRTGTKVVKFSKNKKLCYWDIALEIKLKYFEFSTILIEKPVVRSRYSSHCSVGKLTLWSGFRAHATTTRL